MRKLILIILLGCNFFAEAQIIRANQNYVSNAVSYTFIGDVVTGMRQAYSFRALRSAYTGNCIRVRRSSDNTEQNFGFLNNYLDTAALLTFVGANSGFIVTWYDQSGNAIDATTSTTSKQPRIINAGVFDRLGTRPAMSLADPMALFFTSTTYGDFTWLTVSRKSTTSGLASMFVGNSTSGATYGAEDIDNLGNPTLIIPSGALIYGASGGAGFNASPSGGEILYKITYYNRAGAMCNGGINGAVFTATSKNSGTFVMNQFFQYSTASGAYNYGGLFQEIIMYNSDKGSNRTTLETNINTYYTIY